MKQIIKILLTLIPAVYAIWIYATDKIEGSENLQYVWVLVLLILLSDVVTYTEMFLEYKPMQIVICIGVLFLMIATSTGYYSFELDYLEERVLLQYLSKGFTLSSVLALALGPAIINAYKRQEDKRRGVR